MYKHILSILLLLCCAGKDMAKAQQELYLSSDNQTTWVSFENRTGEKGQAGMENKGAKGHAFDRIPAGDSCVLLSIKGPGMINRMWMTTEIVPETLQNLWIKIYWDGEIHPAVSFPVGDFFGNSLAQMTRFENCFFSSPEGRSMNVTIPMPFRKSAKIILVNQSGKDIHHVFYDINLTILKKWDKKMMYFHSYWNRETPTTLGKDYTILPEIIGKGRFLGMHVGVVADSIYKGAWWGEGEVKFYMDGDHDYPTLCGTGTEDYIGTGWGQGVYTNTYQGCTLADSKKRMWAFYRFHVPDPIYFSERCRVTLQQIGGAGYDEVLQLYNSNVPLIPVSADVPGKGFFKLLETGITLKDPDFPREKAWVNFYRQDDMTSTAYFYLDKPARNQQ